MRDLRIARLIQALPSDETEFIKSQLKVNSNKSYLPLFLSFELLKSTELNREEIYLRVYKKKWTPKTDASFRTDLSRLADFIEEILIQERLRVRIQNDRKCREEERMSLYLELKLSKEAEQQYNEIAESSELSSYSKNIISDHYAEHLVRNHMSLKEKVSLMGMIRDNFRQESITVIEIQEAKHWFLRCMYNYYYKQYNNKFYEDIEVDELLKIAATFTSPEAKYTLLNGLAYMKIDSRQDDISIRVYEEAVELATNLMALNPAFVHHRIKALHLIGTRYSILGDFNNGNTYFEQAIETLPVNQYGNYKTIILNYATNCSKLKQFDKALYLIHLLEDEASADFKLKAECSIRSLSCYLFMENAAAIHEIVTGQDYSLMQPHEKIYFRLSQCNAFIMEKEYEMANVEINNLLRSKLMQEIDADFLPATELLSFMIAAIFKNGRVQLNAAQSKQLSVLKEKINLQQFPYLQHYSPYLWLDQKLAAAK
ncbi:MAG: hypothetical protein U0X41_08220 [Chitinophagales bacterium]